MSSPAGLLKIGNRGHIRRFRNLGEVYMRPLWKFAAEESDPNRGDPYEGASYLWQPRVAQLQVQLDSKFRAIPGHGSIRYSSSLDRNTNVFCMYAITPVDAPTRIDERNQQFGEAFAYITHVEEFLRRVLRAAPSGTCARSDLVEYVDSNLYTGPMTPFRKRRDFEHQCEFRVTVAPGTGSDRTLYVGDLSDLVIIGHTEQIIGRRVRVVSG
jgi:hypothetical protein